MELIDTHCHPQAFKLPLDSALEAAAELGIKRCIAVGTHAADWASYRELAMRYPNRIYHTLGLHPCYLAKNLDAQLEALTQALEHSASPRPVAIGEIGLDLFHTSSTDACYELQREAFAKQLQLAKAHGLPVIVHSRDAFEPCVELIDASGLPWAQVVFHCFSEAPEQMASLLERGGRASFTGNITYPKAEAIREALRLQGAAKLMLETDAPYLPPVPYRGKACEPSMLMQTAQKAAELLEMPLKALAEQTSANAESFFKLSAAAG